MNSKQLVLKKEFCKKNDIQEGDKIHFLMPNFCSGDYTFDIKKNKYNKLYVDEAPLKIFDGCYSYTVIKNENNMSKLKIVLKKYYPHVPKQKTDADTAAMILEDMQNYKLVTVPEMFEYVKEAVNYIYPNSTGVPDEQKQLLNEFFQRSRE